MSFTDFGFNLSSQEKFNQYLTHLASPKKLSCLQFKNGTLDNAGPGRIAFEKFNKAWKQDSTNKTLVELQVIRLIATAEKKGLIGKDQFPLIVQLAQRVGLTSEPKSIGKHYELYALISTIRNRLFSQKTSERPYTKNFDRFIRAYGLNHKSELPKYISSQKPASDSPVHKKLPVDHIVPPSAMPVKLEEEIRESETNRTEQEEKQDQELAGETGLHQESQDSDLSMDQNNSEHQNQEEAPVVSQPLPQFEAPVLLEVKERSPVKKEQSPVVKTETSEIEPNISETHKEIPSIDQLLAELDTEEQQLLEKMTAYIQDQEIADNDLCYLDLMGESYELKAGEGRQNGIKNFVYNFLRVAEGDSFTQNKIEKKLKRTEKLDFNNAYSLLLTTYRLSSLYHNNAETPEEKDLVQNRKKLLAAQLKKLVKENVDAYQNLSELRNPRFDLTTVPQEFDILPLLIKELEPSQTKDYGTLTKVAAIASLAIATVGAAFYTHNTYETMPNQLIVHPQGDLGEDYQRDYKQTREAIKSIDNQPLLDDLLPVDSSLSERGRDELRSDYRLDNELQQDPIYTQRLAEYENWYDRQMYNRYLDSSRLVKMNYKKPVTEKSSPFSYLNYAIPSIIVGGLLTGLALKGISKIYQGIQKPSNTAEDIKLSTKEVESDKEQTNKTYFASTSEEAEDILHGKHRQKGIGELGKPEAKTDDVVFYPNSTNPNIIVVGRRSEGGVEYFHLDMNKFEEECERFKRLHIEIPPRERLTNLLISSSAKEKGKEKDLKNETNGNQDLDPTREKLGPKIAYLLDQKFITNVNVQEILGDKRNKLIKSAVDKINNRKNITTNQINDNLVDKNPAPLDLHIKSFEEIDYKLATCESTNQLNLASDILPINNKFNISFSSESNAIYIYDLKTLTQINLNSDIQPDLTNLKWDVNQRTLTIPLSENTNRIKTTKSDQTEKSDSENSRKEAIELFKQQVSKLPIHNRSHETVELSLTEHLDNENLINFSDHGKLKSATFTFPNSNNKLILSTCQEKDRDQTILLAFGLEDSIPGYIGHLYKWVINSRISLDNIRFTLEDEEVTISLNKNSNHKEKEDPARNSEYLLLITSSDIRKNSNHKEKFEDGEKEKDVVAATNDVANHSQNKTSKELGKLIQEIENDIRQLEESKNQTSLVITPLRDLLIQVKKAKLIKDEKLLTDKIEDFKLIYQSLRMAFSLDIDSKNVESKPSKNKRRNKKKGMASQAKKSSSQNPQEEKLKAYNKHYENLTNNLERDKNIYKDQGLEDQLKIINDLIDRKNLLWKELDLTKRFKELIRISSKRPILPTELRRLHKSLPLASKDIPAVPLHKSLPLPNETSIPNTDLTARPLQPAPFAKNDHDIEKLDNEPTDNEMEKESAKLSLLSSLYKNRNNLIFRQFPENFDLINTNELLKDLKKHRRSIDFESCGQLDLTKPLLLNNAEKILLINHFENKENILLAVLINDETYSVKEWRVDSNLEHKIIGIVDCNVVGNDFRFKFDKDQESRKGDLLEYLASDRLPFRDQKYALASVNLSKKEKEKFKTTGLDSIACKILNPITPQTKSINIVPGNTSELCLYKDCLVHFNTQISGEREVLVWNLMGSETEKELIIASLEALMSNPRITKMQARMGNLRLPILQIEETVHSQEKTKIDNEEEIKSIENEIKKRGGILFGAPDIKELIEKQKVQIKDVEIEKGFSFEDLDSSLEELSKKVKAAKELFDKTFYNEAKNLLTEIIESANVNNSEQCIADAAYMLAILNLEGYGGTTDLEAADKYLKIAFENASPELLIEIGQKFEKRELRNKGETTFDGKQIIESEFAKPETWYHRAADSGNSLAIVKLAFLYQNCQVEMKIDLPNDIDEQAATKHIQSQQKKFSKECYLEVEKLISKLIELGNAEMIFELGFLYEQHYSPANRKITPQIQHYGDYLKAKKLYQAAADLGHLPAIARLAVIEQFGLAIRNENDVQESLKNSKNLFINIEKHAGSEEYYEICYLLGEIYLDRKLSKVRCQRLIDPTKEAADWFNKVEGEKKSAALERLKQIENGEIRALPPKISSARYLMESSNYSLAYSINNTQKTLAQSLLLGGMNKSTLSASSCYYNRALPALPEGSSMMKSSLQAPRSILFANADAPPPPAPPPPFIPTPPAAPIPPTAPIAPTVPSETSASVEQVAADDFNKVKRMLNGLRGKKAESDSDDSDSEEDFDISGEKEEYSSNKDDFARYEEKLEMDLYKGLIHKEKPSYAKIAEECEKMKIETEVPLPYQTLCAINEQKENGAKALQAMTPELFSNISGTIRIGRTLDRITNIKHYNKILNWMLIPTGIRYNEADQIAKRIPLIPLVSTNGHSQSLITLTKNLKSHITVIRNLIGKNVEPGSKEGILKAQKIEQELAKTQTLLQDVFEELPSFVQLELDANNRKHQIYQRDADVHVSKAKVKMMANSGYAAIKDSFDQLTTFLKGMDQFVFDAYTEAFKCNPDGASIDEGNVLLAMDGAIHNSGQLENSEL